MYKLNKIKRDVARLMITTPFPANMRELKVLEVEWRQITFEILKCKFEDLKLPMKWYLCISEGLIAFETESLTKEGLAYLEGMKETFSKIVSEYGYEIIYQYQPLPDGSDTIYFLL